jgi:hypothetical protein
MDATGTLDHPENDKAMADKSVYHLLITGPEANCGAFHLATSAVLSYIDRRDQSAHYTCTAEGFSATLQAAIDADVTLQEIVGTGESVQYPVLHLAEHGMSWENPE